MAERKSIKQIEEQLKQLEKLGNAKEARIKAMLETLRDDDRAGVQKIIIREEKKIEAQKAEIARVEAMKQYEKEYKNYTYICGIDEVGRGPLAGPVVAAAVILPRDCTILYINDSKKLSAKKREQLYREIMRKALSVGIGMVGCERIDEINILQATYEAMRKAINHLTIRPNLLLNDAVTIPDVDIKQVPIIKGDAKSISIAAASIVAKVTRDKMMDAFDEIYPQYDFKNNKGYGSQKHIEALKTYGMTNIHRRSFLKNFHLEEK